MIHELEDVQREILCVFTSPYVYICACLLFLVQEAEVYPVSEELWFFQHRRGWNDFENLLNLGVLYRSENHLRKHFITIA